MKTFKQIFLPMRQILLTLIFCFAIVGAMSLVYAYEGPPGNPPACPTGYPGCDAPLNVSSVKQIIDAGKSLSIKNYNGTENIGILTLLGGLKTEGVGTFSGSVGIGTNNLSVNDEISTLSKNKLSVLGNVRLLREPGPDVSSGPGPILSLESPSNNVTRAPGTIVSCSTDCGTDNTPTKDNENIYTCPLGSGGASYSNDVYKSGTTSYSKSSITCVAKTDSYSLTTTAGTLNFVNSSGASKFTLGQDGVMGVGKVNFGNGKFSVTGDSNGLIIESNSGNKANITEIITKTTSQTFCAGGVADTCDGNKNSWYTCTTNKTCVDINNQSNDGCGRQRYKSVTCKQNFNLSGTWGMGNLSVGSITSNSSINTEGDISANNLPTARVPVYACPVSGASQCSGCLGQLTTASTCSSSDMVTGIGEGSQTSCSYPSSVSCTAVGDLIGYKQ